MFSRITACWLVVLILAPFTAPFPTCDLATFVGRHPTRQTPIVPPVSAAVSHDAAVTATAFLGHGRTRLLSNFRIAQLCNEVSVPCAMFLRSVGTTRDVRDTAALNTVLRV
jgi:hypothetical protein